MNRQLHSPTTCALAVAIARPRLHTSGSCDGNPVRTRGVTAIHVNLEIQSRSFVAVRLGSEARATYVLHRFGTSGTQTKHMLLRKSRATTPATCCSIGGSEAPPFMLRSFVTRLNLFLVVSSFLYIISCLGFPFCWFMQVLGGFLQSKYKIEYPGVIKGGIMPSDLSHMFDYYFSTVFL